MNLAFIAALACALTITSASAQKVTAVRLAKLWDGDKVIEHPVVIIEGDRIVRVLAGDAAPPLGADVVDWSRFTGLPG